MYIRTPTGQEKTVSIRHLAPPGSDREPQTDPAGNINNIREPPQVLDNAVLEPVPEVNLHELQPVEPDTPATPVITKPKRLPLLLKQLQDYNTPGEKEQLQSIPGGRVTRSRQQ